MREFTDSDRITPDEIAFQVMKVSHLHRTTVENYMNRCNMGISPAQHRILITIAHNNRVNQKELAKMLEVSPATVTICLKKLVKENYIKKESLENDNRYNILEVTEKGKKIIDKSVKSISEIDNKMFDNFSEEELRIFSGYLNRIYNNLSEK